jgi:exopolysaccharide biosynthesis protein
MQRQFLVAAGTALLLLPLLAYGRLHFLRPPRTAQVQTLFPGITYKREAQSIPRPVMIHFVTIDLRTSGLKVLVTPKTPDNARTTSDFARKFKPQLAINASFFGPFHEHTPWDYYPRPGDRTEPIGEVISNGNRYSLPRPPWAVLCVSRDSIVKIVAEGICPQGTFNAAAGGQILVSNGKPTTEVMTYVSDDRPSPRVAVALDRQGEKLWVIVVDGKQPLYSEGLTKLELAQIIVKLGADRALNLDGGGSTTLVTATDNGVKVLNAPIQAKLPMNERPVANHIGFYINKN